MRKIILLLFTLIFSQILLAQKFVVTSEGLRNSDDNGLEYIVLEMEGYSSNHMYDLYLDFIEKNMTNPDASLKGNKINEYLRFTTSINNAFKYNNNGAKMPVDVIYDTELRFKDNRLRIDFTNIKMQSGRYNVSFIGDKWAGYVIYDKKGKLYRADTKKDIEDFFNGIVSLLIDYKVKAIDDDW